MPPPRLLERIRPFPWRSLRATTPAEVTALHEVRRWAAAHLRLGAFALAFEQILGARVEVIVGRVQTPGRATGAGALDRGVGAIVVPADAPDAGGGALIEAEGPLAATLVARALGRPAPLLTRPTSAPSEGIAGAFAAVVIAAARRAHAGVALRVLEAGAAIELEGEMAGVDPELLAVSLTVLVADEAFAARVIVSRRACLSCAPGAWDLHALVALGSTPLAVPIVACATFVTPEEIAFLRRGDAIVPRHWPIERREDGTTVGPVLLASPSSELGLVARLCEDGRLVLRGGLEPLVAREAPMDSDEKNAAVAMLGAVPIVMRVEIGEAVMTAREWASLASGDVISLGRRLGEPVTLRVGGVPMARGELVELEGEVAVRILDRLDSEGTTA